MSANPTADVGAWNGDLDQLMKAWLTGQGSDTDLPEALRFLLAVRRLTLNREREPDCEFDRAAAMVLVPPAFFESPPPGTHRRPLLYNGNYPLTGQLHFLNVSAAGRSLEYIGDQGALFDTLEATHVTALPTVIYDPKANGLSKLSWYPGGVGDASKVTVIPVAVEEPTAARVMEAINGVYHGDLKTPDQISPEFNPWMDAAKDGRPKKRRPLCSGRSSSACMVASRSAASTPNSRARTVAPTLRWSAISRSRPARSPTSRYSR